MAELKTDLLKLVREKPFNYAQCCASKKYVKLLKRLMQETSFLPNTIDVKTRIFYVLNDIKEPIKCCVCGKVIDKSIITLEYGYNKEQPWTNESIKYIACRNKDCIHIACARKIENTCMQKYGVKNPYMVEAFKEKSKHTCIERYGTPSGGNTKEAREKAKRTWIEKYGVDSPMKNADIFKKTRNTCLARYGSAFYMQCDQGRSKMSEAKAKTLVERMLSDP